MTPTPRLSILLAATTLLLACDDLGLEPPDAPAARDAGEPRDAGAPATDGGPPGEDAGARDPARDAGQAGSPSIGVIPLGSPGPDYVKALAVDDDGDVWAALTFGGVVDVGGGAPIRSAAGTDVGVVRFDGRTGSPSDRFSFGGAGGQVPHGIVTVPGGVVVVGYALAPAPGAPVEVQLSPSERRVGSGGEKPFAARFDAAGGLVWGWMLDHPTSASSRARIWDLARWHDDVVVVGSFDGALDVDPGAGELTLRSDGAAPDLFVARYSGSDGALRWARRLGGPLHDAGTGAAVAPGGTGDVSVAVHGDAIVVVGGFRGTASFGDATRDSRGGTDVFLARFREDGEVAGVITLGSAADDVTAPGGARSSPAGELFFAVRATGEIDLSEVGGDVAAGAPASGLVVLGLDLELGLRHRVDLESPADNHGAHRVAAVDGALYVAGWYQGPMDFDGGEAEVVRGPYAEAPRGVDPFLARYALDSGALDWVVTPAADPGHTASQIVAGLAVDGDGHPWIGGQIFVSTDFATGPEPAWVEVVGLNDGFLASYDSVRGTLR